MTLRCFSGENILKLYYENSRYLIFFFCLLFKTPANAADPTNANPANAVNPVKVENTARKRYIVFHKNPNLISEHIKKKGRKAIRRGRNLPAVIAELSSTEIAELKSNVPGANLVEDRAVHAAFEQSSVQIERTATNNKGSQRSDWGYKLIRAVRANRISKGSDVRVCVVDTGIDQTHKDLVGNIAGGKNFTTDDPNAWQDDNGHGTHVAGIIAALNNRVGIVGVAPMAKIYAMKVIGASGYGTLSSVADGVLECIKIGANVINMSLAAQKGPPEAYVDPMAIAVQAAINAGIKVVVASGNNAQDMANYIPASYPGVITVGAIQVVQKSKIQLLYFSNIGLGAKDYVAPGGNVRSTWTGGQYAVASGTSMAAPHVAGVVALMLSRNAPNLKAKNINLPLSHQGSGVVDAYATVLNK